MHVQMLQCNFIEWHRRAMMRGGVTVSHSTMEDKHGGGGGGGDGHHG